MRWEKALGTAEAEGAAVAHGQTPTWLVGQKVTRRGRAGCAKGRWCLMREG